MLLVLFLVQFTEFQIQKKNPAIRKLKFFENILNDGKKIFKDIKDVGFVQPKNPQGNLGSRHVLYFTDDLLLSLTQFYDSLEMWRSLAQLSL